MPAAVPIILALGAVGVVGLLLWLPIRERLGKDALVGRCEALEGQLAQLNLASADLAQRASIQAQLDQCKSQMQEAGIPVDELASIVAQITGTRARIRGEYNHFRSTDWSDSVKRGNTFSGWLALGDELALLYRRGIQTVEDGPPAAKLDGFGILLREVNIDRTRANDRIICFNTGGSGCGASRGHSEAEKQRIWTPLDDVRSELMGLIAEAGSEPVEPSAGAALPFDSGLAVSE